jgi:hypothetical protein
MLLDFSVSIKLPVVTNVKPHDPGNTVPGHLAADLTEGDGIRKFVLIPGGLEGPTVPCFFLHGSDIFHLIPLGCIITWLILAIESFGLCILQDPETVIP